MGDLRAWNQPATPVDRGGNTNRVPVYSASDVGMGIEYFPPQMEQPKSLIRSLSSALAGTEPMEGERSLYKVGQEGKTHDVLTREGRTGLSEDLGLPNKKARKRRK
jgi:hypothetical protein